MALSLDPPLSRVRERDGVLWLEPPRASVWWRRAVLLVPLVVATALAMPLVEGLGTLAANAAIAALAVLALLALAAWRRAGGSRLGATEAGLLLAAGRHSRVLGWAAIDDVAVADDDGESRLVVRTAGEALVLPGRVRPSAGQVLRERAQALAEGVDEAADPGRRGPQGGGDGAQRPGGGGGPTGPDGGDEPAGPGGWGGAG